MSEERKNLEASLEQSPQSALERKLIAEYLHGKGYAVSDLKNLPEQQAKALMSEACRHAALELAEIESRARFRQEIKAPD